MSGQVLHFTSTFIDAGACIECGVQMIMPQWFYSKRREDHKDFYCINGHAQHFSGKSEAEKLREELEREKLRHQHTREREESLRQTRNHLEHRVNGMKGALTKVKKRIAKGVCPSCNRTFTDLKRHMACKHPSFETTED